MPSCRRPSLRYRTLSAAARIAPRSAVRAFGRYRRAFQGQDTDAPASAEPPGSLTAVTHDLSPTPREQLLELIKTLAVVHGKVTLSSGREADYYVDLRRVTLHHRPPR